MAPPDSSKNVSAIEDQKLGSQTLPVSTTERCSRPHRYGLQVCVTENVTGRCIHLCLILEK
jgi:hypothetical protein